MKSTPHYLDEIKARHNLRSDFALAKLLEIQPGHVASYRKGRSNFDDAMSLKVAELLGIDPAVVLADMNAARTKCPAAREVWERVARSYSTAASVIFAVFLAVFLFSAAPSPAQASAAQHVEHCLLC